MRAFVLSTGRCGSMTFARACGHATNFTAAHESRAHVLGPGRLAYPDQHVEVDNRLSWFLGGLQRLYGDEPLYVHLTRDPEEVARSYAKRTHVRAGILPAFASGILRRRAGSPLPTARAYVECVTDNIEAFLAGKSTVVRTSLEAAPERLELVWHLLGARGDLPAAQREFSVIHNASPR